MQLSLLLRGSSCRPCVALGSGTRIAHPPPKSRAFCKAQFLWCFAECGFVLKWKECLYCKCQAYACSLTTSSRITTTLGKQGNAGYEAGAAVAPVVGLLISYSCPSASISLSSIGTHVCVCGGGGANG
jgi:hypothetical protein